MIEPQLSSFTRVVEDVGDQKIRRRAFSLRSGVPWLSPVALTLLAAPASGLASPGRSAPASATSQIPNPNLSSAVRNSYRSPRRPTGNRSVPVLRRVPEEAARWLRL